MKLTPCLEMFFTDLPFTERVAAVAKAGYSAAEFWGHENKDLKAVSAVAKANGVAITSMTACGNLVDCSKHAEAEEQLKRAIEVAEIVGCERLIVLSGNVIPGMTRCEHVKNCITGLKRLAPIAAAA